MDLTGLFDVLGKFLERLFGKIIKEKDKKLLDFPGADLMTIIFIGLLIIIAWIVYYLVNIKLIWYLIMSIIVILVLFIPITLFVLRRYVPYKINKIKKENNIKD